MSVDVKALQKKMIDHDIKTIGELSAISGVDRNTLGKVFAHKVKPSANVMEKLIVSLELSGSEAGAIFFANKLT